MSLAAQVAIICSCEIKACCLLIIIQQALAVPVLCLKAGRAEISSVAVRVLFAESLLKNDEYIS